jgi:hypothetical protein
MASEIRQKPIPTPHPDQPRAAGAAGDRGRKGREEPLKEEEYDPDDAAYDSCVDDSNLHLTAPVSEPDPALNSNDLAELEKKRDQPRTSEIFETVRPGSGELTTRRTGWTKRFFSRLKGGAAGSRATETRGTGDAIPAPHRTGEIRRVDAGSDDDENGNEARGIWLPMLLLSYSSAVTLGLAWVLWSGRTIHPGGSEQTASEAPQAADLQPGRSADDLAKAKLPPIPEENVASIGQTVRIGDVEITPFAVALAPVELVRKIEPAEYRVEEVPSLVLKLRLTNLSKEHSFKPLARSLIGDAASTLDRSFVATADEGKIALYPLAVESEWLITGQEFSVLKPGDSVATLVASEPVSEDRLRDEMTLRIRLRIGPYRTDILGVRFSRSEISQ